MYIPRAAVAAAGALLLGVLTCHAQSGTRPRPSAAPAMQAEQQSGSTAHDSDGWGDPETDSWVRTMQTYRRPQLPVAKAIETWKLPNLQAFLARHKQLPGLLPTAEDDADAVMNGFGDAENTRYEVIFTKVQPVDGQPGTWQVQGKSRYKSEIKTFRGTVRWTQLWGFKPQDPAEVGHFSDQIGVQVPLPWHGLTGTFSLKEDGPNAGQIAGTVAANFTISNPGFPLFITRFGQAQAKGAGTLFEGQWVGPAGTPRRGVRWGLHFLDHAATISTDFERRFGGYNISPEYKSRGWGTYYEKAPWW
ncbi:hypothetical protein [Hymenobacter latericus]|uniref:hypothetical protein n=1 Tax=Hymenobacter sp. YIM 151858-1 TaxID=2987688 RepID=UPI00222725A5|nr:hypothetical protein [Hymenobacter sp. YIM 151858-1]UYZ59874.1 hypothetical protein OIS50_03540 [Hymenobacter sp. YIM 151858-1]